MHDRPSPRADLVWALAWIAFGAAALYGAWTMDRLEKMNINPYTVPGLVPGLLGAGILLLGVLLLVRALRTPAEGAAQSAPPPEARGRLALTLSLCLLYGAGLVGRGLPFWAATFLFVFAAVALLQWPERRARRETARGLVFAAICAAATAAGVTLVFQEFFLVRLP